MLRRVNGWIESCPARYADGFIGRASSRLNEDRGSLLPAIEISTSRQRSEWSASSDRFANNLRGNRGNRDKSQRKDTDNIPQMDRNACREKIASLAEN